MHKLTYLAVLEPSSDGYGVFFPDLPGCFSFGTTLSEAQANAQEALELHIYGLEKDNDPIPTPSQNLSKEYTAGNIVCAVSIFPDIVRNEMANRRVKTNTTIPAWLKELAEKQGVNFSKLLENSLMDYLNLKTP